MDDTTGKGLSLTGTIFITIGYITLGVLLFALVVAGVKVAQDRMTGITDQLQQAEYTTFDNGTMSGSQVLNSIRQYMNNDQFGIEVTTGKNSTTFYGNTFSNEGEIIGNTKNTDLKPAQNQASTDYINPSGKFKTSLVYDKNGVVRGLKMKQSTLATP
ncbi:ABC transporter permease [Priestia sp. BR_2]